MDFKEWAAVVDTVAVIPIWLYVRSAIYQHGELSKPHPSNWGSSAEALSNICAFIQMACSHKGRNRVVSV